MRYVLIFVALAAPPALIASSARAYERLQGPTELLYWNKDKAFNGYTLFGVGRRTFLLDMEGRVVHTWPIGTNPHLLDNGHILDASRDDPSGFWGFKEVDWDGKVVWEYVEKQEGYAPHHDWVRLFNKALGAWTTMYIANRSITHEQAIAAGCDPKKGRLISRQVVWSYQSRNNHGFFSHIGSSAQRPPRGDGATGARPAPPSGAAAGAQPASTSPAHAAATAHPLDMRSPRPFSRPSGRGHAVDYCLRG
jgi:hypothetical protein